MEKTDKIIGCKNIRDIVRLQLDAMQCENFEVGIFKRSDQKKNSRMEIRENQSKKDIIGSTEFLKKQNKIGRDIYIRPSGVSGLIFFDDLSISQLAKLECFGIKASVIIESSRLNYQGWIKLERRKLNNDHELVTACCKVIAKQFGGDIKSADWRHFGRLCGFLNQKNNHIDECGNKPVVNLVDFNEGTTPKSDFIIEEGVKILKERERKISKLSRRKFQSKNDKFSNKLYVKKVFDTEYQRMIGFFGKELDLSNFDYQFAKKLFTLGASWNQTYNALLDNSINLKDRKGRHVSSYLTITIDKIYSNAE